jgi:hypothetical protein
MKITMMPHSGVLVYDYAEYAYPVVGWLEKEHEGGGLVLMPMILAKGLITALDDERVAYDIVGVGERWMQVLEYHNASGEGGTVRYGTPGA